MREKLFLHFARNRDFVFQPLSLFLLFDEFGYDAVISLNDSPKTPNWSRCLTRTRCENHPGG